MKQHKMFLEKYKYVIEYDSTASIAKDTISEKTLSIKRIKNDRRLIK